MTEKARFFSQPYNYRVVFCFFVFCFRFNSTNVSVYMEPAAGLSWVLNSVTGDCLLERLMLSSSTTVNVCGLSSVNKRFTDRIPARRPCVGTSINM